MQPERRKISVNADAAATANARSRSARFIQPPDIGSDARYKKLCANRERGREDGRRAGIMMECRYNEERID